MRKVLFWLHLLTGCIAGVVILIMSVTGVLLAYERQIRGWMDRDLRSSAPAAGSPRLPIEAMLAKVVSQNDAMPSAIALRTGVRDPAEVSFGRERVVLVDPYLGNVLGESSNGTRLFFQKVENWHRWLGTSNRDLGRGVTGACNFGFLFLVISGPFLWTPRKWSWPNVRAVATFRRGLSGRARDYNWHNVIGIWCAIPLFVIVLSGVVMSYPWANNLLYKITGNEPPAAPAVRPGGEARPAAAPSSLSLAGLNVLFTRAEQQVPAWRSITLRLPTQNRAPVTFTIDTGDGGRPDQRSQLMLDRRSGEVIRYEQFSSYNAGRRLRSWFRFLHTGEAGGLAGQSIAAISSAGAATLVWTGLWLAARRLVRWKKRQRSVQPEMSNAVSANR